MRKGIQIAIAIQLSVLLFSFAPSLALAGAKPDDKGTRANSLEGGSWSLQFGITDEIGLKPFNNMSISLKRHMSPRSAFRLGVNLGLDFDDTDQDQSEVVADTLATATVEDRNTSSQELQLNMLYMYYPAPGANVNFFLGTGPLVRYSRSTVERERSYTSKGKVVLDITDQSQRSWRFGALGVGGVEWFATRGISFHAEYRASVSYGRSKGEQETLYVYPDDPTRIRESEASTSFWDFHGVAVSLGVSIYF